MKSHTSIEKALNAPNTVETLNLSGQKTLENLPTSISTFRNLKKLYLQDTSIRTRPSSLAQCKKLEVLDLRGTNISTFPRVILQLKHLKELYFYSEDPDYAPQQR
ncbi:hypothetical protein GF342_03295 [Candidatus Woesearchaeota archaeon]|nr:hypothetical protein [Candidatus Woesearchaeota archaeon]